MLNPLTSCKLTNDKLVKDTLSAKSHWRTIIQIIIIYLPGNLETLEELPEVLHQALLDGVESEKIQTKFEKQVTEASTLSLNRMNLQNTKMIFQVYMNKDL